MAWVYLLGLALALWGVCGAIMAIGRKVWSLDTALRIHLAVAPIVAFLVSAIHKKLSEEAVRAGFENKFWGYWRVIRALAPRLSSNGAIVMVGGAAGRAAIPGTSALAAVNAAIAAAAQVLAVELAPRRVNVVSPGTTDTEACNRMSPQDRHMLANAAAKLPVSRVGQPDDLAEAILFALGNPFLTGAVLDVDGGVHLPRG
jgi:NAD(P)-dependent dehydrogenase (short-subunit alcohol dehydrogenase family)